MEVNYEKKGDVIIKTSNKIEELDMKEMLVERERVSRELERIKERNLELLSDYKETKSLLDLVESKILELGGELDEFQTIE